MNHLDCEAGLQLVCTSLEKPERSGERPSRQSFEPMTWLVRQEESYEPVILFEKR